MDYAQDEYDSTDEDKVLFLKGVSAIKILITGSSGLIGSEAVRYFGDKGHAIVGIDNNFREFFFGKPGDTTWNLKKLLSCGYDFIHLDADIRDRSRMLDIFRDHRPDAVIHCAAQPSHDLAAKMPFEDFDVNAGGTINLLEASRRFTFDSPFIFMSTNKVYGDAPNEIELVETPTRWDYKYPAYYYGIDESCRIDRTKHSLFGASKAAADLITQEYGLYFNMPTVCFRGGCLTGPSHSGVELHGFLSYLVKVAVNDMPYTIFGYKGKQVRDQIHSQDVVRAFECYMKNPRPGEVYNIGGGRDNSASILECIDMIYELSGRRVRHTLSEQNRIGDHICYISDTRKLESHYGEWDRKVSLKQIIKQMVDAHGA
jgi:CDP-paratose 2-epimerase